MIARALTTGTVQYLVALPTSGQPDKPLDLEPIVRTLAATRSVSWDYIAEPALGRAQMGILVAEQSSPWDLIVAAEVSERMGGFVLVTESDERTMAGGTALVYAGRILRAWRRDFSGRIVLRAGVRKVPDDAGIDSSDLVQLLTGRAPGTLHPSWALSSGVAPAAGRAETARPEGELPPVRADFMQVVLDCDEDRWRLALDRHGPPTPDGGGWRWRPDRTPEAAVPFVMLRGPGPLQPEWVARLAGETGGFGAAAEVRSQQDGDARPVPWAWVAPGEDPRNGAAEDGFAAVEVWHGIATVLGSYAAALDWPAAEPGNWLTLPGHSTLG